MLELGQTIRKFSSPLLKFCVVLDQKKYKHKLKSFHQEKQMVKFFVEALRSAEER